MHDACLRRFDTRPRRQRRAAADVYDMLTTFVCAMEQRLMLMLCVRRARLFAIFRTPTGATPISPRRYCWHATRPRAPFYMMPIFAACRPARSRLLVFRNKKLLLLAALLDMFFFATVAQQPPRAARQRHTGERSHRSACPRQRRS